MLVQRKWLESINMNICVHFKLLTIHLNIYHILMHLTSTGPA